MMTKFLQRPSETTKAARNLTEAQAEALAGRLTVVLKDTALSQDEQAAQIAKVEADILKRGGSDG
jgi:hypothetical protein